MNTSKIKIKIGITGQSGFMGWHLYNTIKLYPEEFQLIEFEKRYFQEVALMDRFVAESDVILHLAGMNRHEDQQIVYQTNLTLTDILIASVKRTKSSAHIFFSSSIQELNENTYGLSKRDSRIRFINESKELGFKFTALLIPNVFGPFGIPFYNSVVATFCYQINNGQVPTVDTDRSLNLIYISELVNIFLDLIRSGKTGDEIVVANTTTIYVTDILSKLMVYKDVYLANSHFPHLPTTFEVNLFNTFRSFMNHKGIYPAKFKCHADERGLFSELVKTFSQGQTSFSTTFSGITRGNHFHTRKIERFAVIKGSALIQLRKIGTNEVLDFYLSGSEPAYVDMPVWYTHNIKNTGNDELYTIFWINEFYNSDDPDTFFEEL